MPSLKLRDASGLAAQSTAKSHTAIESEPSIVSASGGAAKEPADSTEKQNWDRLLNRVIDWNLAPGEFDEDGYQNPTRQALDRLLPLLLDLKARYQLIPDRLVIDVWGGATMKFYRGENEVDINVLETGAVELRIYRNNELVHRSEL